MEPFVADKDEHYGERREPARNRNAARPYVLLMLFTTAVLLVFSGTMVAMLLSQQKSFDALRDNFQTLQSSLSPESATPEAEVDTGPEPADTTQDEVAPPAPLDIAATPAFTALSRKVGDIETTLGKLSSQVSAVTANMPSDKGAPSAEIRQLSSSVAAINDALSALRNDLLTIEVSLNDLANSDTETALRLDSMEKAVISLNEYRRENASAGSTVDARTIATLQRDIRLLKQQHPYLRD